MTASATAHDPSTLAALHPAQPREQHYKGYKTSARLAGSHMMTLRRPSRVPEYSRLYAPGDPTGLIDWKAFARTDQLLLREVRDEATARVMIGLDVSDTMRWPDPEVPVASPPPPKAEVAARVALNLAHLHLRMGDLVEIWLYTDESGGAAAGRLSPRSPSDVVSLFGRLSLGGFTPTSFREVFPDHPGETRARDVAVWVGDALGKADYQEFLGRGRRSLLLHVLSSLETDIAWIDNDISYFDIGAVRKEYQGAVLRHRENYLKHLGHWQTRLAARQRKAGGDYYGVTDRTAIAQYQQALAGFAATAGRVP